ncbi:MAG: hypothetical protein IPM55_10835 [Acidobacteria bacterium]|nr:hypothetical protein [Acidobacteriota bacterium]
MQGVTRARPVFFSRARQLDEGIFLRGTQIIERQGGRERSLIDRSERFSPGATTISKTSMAALPSDRSAGSCRIDAIDDQPV